MDSLRVFYIRSTSIINDSRASKEISSLINNGFKVTVVGWDRDSRLSNSSKLNINGNDVDAIMFTMKSKYGGSISTILGLACFQAWLYKTLKRNIKNYEVLHACDFDCGFIANKIAKKYNKKLVYDMYDYYTDSRPMPGPLQNLISNKENNIINNADVSIICGEWRTKQIAKSNPKKLIVIHNTPDLDFTSDNKIIKSSTDKLKVAYVGILQNFRLLLEVLEQFKQHPEYELHIGGFGEYEEEIKKASKNHENIIYYGSLHYNQVLSLERDCNVLFATYDPQIQNHKYSAPNKVYEAMALGKPIVVCKGTGIDELVTTNKIGYAIDYDGKQFIDVLKNLNKKDLNTLKNKSLDLYKNKYSWKIMENILVGAYNDL